MTRYEAARLFVERAGAALPGFALTDENASAVAHLCYQLDGIPLAIELAAARVKVLSIEDMAQRLHDRLRLLTGGSRSALPRHQTLRGTLDWSYDLLSEAERVLFRRLAVFAGGWTLEGAEAVCPGDGVTAGDVLDLLAQLVDKSLVLVEPNPERLRYRLLETTRQYALERLVESAEADVMRQAHSDFFVALAERADPELRGQRALEWMERLDREGDNLRATLQRAGERDDTETALRLVAALWDFWWMRGYLSEGQGWAEHTLSREGQAASRARGRALNAAGTIAGVRGEFLRAESWLAESVATFRALQDAVGVIRPLADLASTKWFQGDLSQAAALIDEALRIARTAGPSWELGYALYASGFQLANTGRDAEAIPLLEGAVAAYRGLSDRRGLAYSLLELGAVVRRQGDMPRAAALGTEGLDLFWQLGETHGLVGSLVLLAALAEREGRTDGATRLLGTADKLCEAIGAALLPPWRAEFERTSSAARAALGEASFQAAWETGRAMPLTDAIAFAESDVLDERAAAAGPAPSPRGHDSLGFTRRELEVINLLARGTTNRQIGAELVIAEGTAALHVKHILHKLGFESRAQVTAWAVQHGDVLAPASAAG